MRDIKFRAWDGKTKEWLCGYELPNLGGFSLFGETILLGEWSDVLGRFLVTQKDREPHDLTVEQYTGLKDKNGKEIYEGDIVHNGPANWLVKYGEGAFVVDIIGSAVSPRPLHLRGLIGGEIIGNIHENPELL